MIIFGNMGKHWYKLALYIAHNFRIKEW
jgi:hypothetical protein